MSSHPRYVLKTLGCKANLYDSQLIEAELQKRGWKAAQGDQESLADLCIVNSCTVTDEADRQSRKMASRLSRDNPDTRVVITGCSAEVDPEMLAKTQGVDYVIGNRDKPKLVDLVLEAISKPQVERGQVLGVAHGYTEMLSRHPMDREWDEPESVFFAPPPVLEGESERTRAFLKIQDGCNSFCTYCVIPYGRGPSRSLSIPEVVKQIQDLVSRGIREVVITGINIGDYGTDWGQGPRVEDLFESIFAQTQLERLRVSSLDPTEITPRLIQLMKTESRFCPHFHVSLQSPQSRVLKLMKRKYSWEHVKECLEKIAEIPAPAGGVFVGMDVITGFPGEGIDEFEWSREALASLPWSRLHVFPYSERAGTPATRLPNVVSKEERVRRARELRALSFERLKGLYNGVIEEYRERGVPLQSILIENSTRGPDGTNRWVSGYTSNYLRVILPAQSEDEAKRLWNTIVSAEPIQVLLDAPGGDVAFLGKLVHLQ